MKNYAEMSDSEINHEVARHFFDAAWLDRHYGKEGMVPNYCNSWDDAGPIIHENKIGGHYGKATPNLYFALSRNEWIIVENKNQLRAAMIVFLMMKDAAK